MAERMKQEAGLSVIEAEPASEDAITHLEQVLEEARAGKISSVAIAIVYRDGSNRPQWSDAPNMGILIGAVSRLQWSLNQALDEA